MTTAEVQAKEVSQKDTLALAQATTHQKTAKTNAEGTVRDYFKDIPIMARIAWCESKYYHTDPKSGQTIRGIINRNDIGIMQINEVYHGKAAESLGLDIYSLDGNLRYARHLYSIEGTRPWRSSKDCWGGNAPIAQK